MKIIITSLLVVILSSAQAMDKTRILVITGGHTYEQESFRKMWDSFNELEVHYAEHPNANDLYALEKMKRIDVLVFYDMVQEITPDQKQALVNLLQTGKGMVFLHHSLASYQEWDHFFDIVGGRYLLKAQTLMNNSYPASTYQHDVNIPVNIVKKDHPITKGLKNWTLYDEGYGNIVVKPDVTVLLTTDHPASSRELVWCHKLYNARIVTIQPGHDHHAYEDKNYQKLLIQAIEWAKNSKTPSQ